jgi:hypothetical protein
MSSGGGMGNPYTRAQAANPPQSGGMYGASNMGGGGDMLARPSGGSSMSPDQQFMAQGMMDSFAAAPSYQAIQELQQQLMMAQAQGAPPSVIASLQARLQQAQEAFQRQNQIESAKYGASGGDNPYIAQLIGMGVPNARQYNTMGAGPMRSR